ncbi:ADP-ribosylation factor GTPase-activating protein [Musa troglodytarum]|uniref:ADP-ribosylation factor GTPase-activating protein n=1 Tax=Musa troglodytarum TaxID=320322 RepID=A0A9E7HS31_9LILI|nr:ADP-ribosylation factor GTPase-activating protein [Musa troglodytarum]
MRSIRTYPRERSRTCHNTVACSGDEIRGQLTLAMKLHGSFLLYLVHNPWSYRNPRKHGRRTDQTSTTARNNSSSHQNSSNYLGHIIRYQIQPPQMIRSPPHSSRE